MITVDIKSLVTRLNPYCTSMLEGAAGLCLGRTNYEVTVEHFLAKAMEDLQSDIPLILKQFDIDVGVVQRAVNEAIEDLKTGNAGKPVFSPLLLELVQEAWLISSIDFFDRKIRSGAVLAALLGRASFFSSGAYVDMLRGVKRDALKEGIHAIVAGSIEGAIQSDDGSAGDGGAGKGGAAGGPVRGDGSALSRFCVDFTAKAREGGIDPVFGRDDEIRQMVDILARRRKNNPIAVGDPGVGKTAVVEGMALRIVEGDVPDLLKGVSLIGLDMGLLEAGASVKGEFEKRLKGVIDEIKASTIPIILFIDEAHTLVGAGGSAGGSDAANLLKPALARGELRTIAATTWSEYKKYFEKDPALARRFQLVKLEEPSVATTKLILRGLKDSYEKVHDVIMRDDAIVAAAELSDRYIIGRKLPDKAIDLLDTAAARVKVSISSKPAALEDLERTIMALAREKKAMERDKAYNNPVDEERLAEIDVVTEKTNADIEVLTAKWLKEKAAADELIVARREYYSLISGDEPAIVQTSDEADSTQEPASSGEGKTSEDEETINLDDAKARLIKAEEALDEAADGDRLIHLEVEPEVVSKVVADWTGVPLGNLLKDEAQSVLKLEENLRKSIVGQDEALSIMAEIIRSSKAGVKDPAQPIGVFMLVGSSGVGKTETALTLADLMFGGERSVVTINMSEFQEKHTVSRLIGSPPGYVGYGEGGILTEAVRQRPYSIVLLDEVEKAHIDVLNLFYQVFDKGMLSDSEGRMVDFKNTVVILTSNLATDVIHEMCAEGERPDHDLLLTAIRPILSAHFKPALLARTTIAPFYTLPAEALKGIIKLKLKKIADRLMRNNKMVFDFTEKVVDQIAARCTEVETGARNIDYILNGSVMPQMSREILSFMSQDESPQGVTLDLNEDESFKIEFR